MEDRRLSGGEASDSARQTVTYHRTQSVKWGQYCYFLHRALVKMKDVCKVLSRVLGIWKTLNNRAPVAIIVGVTQKPSGWGRKDISLGARNLRTCI